MVAEYNKALFGSIASISVEKPADYGTTIIMWFLDWGRMLLDKIVPVPVMTDDVTAAIHGLVYLGLVYLVIHFIPNVNSGNNNLPPVGDPTVAAGK